MDDAESTYMKNDDIDSFKLMNGFAKKSLSFNENNLLYANDKTMDL
jgi:hypothetical protein